MAKSSQCKKKTLQDHHDNQAQASFDRLETTNVLVIGNGPSAITTSFLLAGHWPYYSPDLCEPHPLKYLHDRLLYHCSIQPDDPDDDVQLLNKPKFRSLMESDLMELSEGLVGRGNNNPVAILMDQLQHPNADFNEQLPSTLNWTYSKERQIDHIVVGSSREPGGLWHTIAKISSKHRQPGGAELLTLSRRSLMQLPVLEIRDPKTEQDYETPVEDKRVPYRLVADYYRRYVEYFDLSKFFRNKTRATRLTWDHDQKCFVVDTVCGNKSKFVTRILAKKVVIAKGTSTSPRMLNIPGETLPFVLHSLTKLDLVIKQTQLLPYWRIYLANQQNTNPVLIVGSGLSAADALIFLSQRCQRRPLRIIHVFRKSIKDRSLIYNQLAATNNTAYPEYHEILKLMKQSVQNAQCLDCFQNASKPSSSSSSSSNQLKFQKYQAFQECILTSIGKKCSKQATIEFLNPQSCSQCSECQKPLNHRSTIPISFAIILIGSRPQLEFVNDDILARLAIDPKMPFDVRQNPIDMDPYTYECRKMPGLYALGPLVGDNFVRHLQGGALAASNHIWNRDKQQNYVPSGSDLTDLI